MKDFFHLKARFLLCFLLLCTGGTILGQAHTEIVPGTAFVAISSNITTACTGQTVVFEVESTINAGTSPSFTWYVNGAAKAGGTSYSSASLTNGSQVYCQMVSSLSTVTAPAKSATITITVTAASAPSVSIAATATSICAGTSVTFTATPVNGGSAPGYQWEIGGSPVAGATGSTYTNSSLGNGQVVSCVMTSSSTCVTTSSATSNAITMTVNTPKTMVVTVQGNNPVCSGNSAQVSAGVSNSAGNLTYTWELNGTVVTSDVSVPFPYVFVKNSPVNGAVINCVVHTDATCYNNNAVSNNYVISVVSPIGFSVSVGPTTGLTYCQGASVSYTATSASTIGQYQWTAGGAPISGATSSVYTTTASSAAQLQAIGINATALSGGCTVGSSTASANAASIPFVVNPVVTPAVSIVSGSVGNNVCSGSPVTFTATPTNGGSTPAYQWMVNGSSVSGATGSTYTTSGLTNGAVVSCQMTSSAPCATTPTVVSNSLTMTVINTQSLVVTVTGNNPICGSNSASVSAGVANIAGNLTYQWEYNGAVVSSDQSTPFPYTFIKNSPVNGAVINCLVSTDAACYTNPAISNNYTVVISTPVSFSVSAGPTTGLSYCQGDSVTFAASSNQSISQYQWTAGGATIAGATGPTYTTTASSVTQLQSIGVTATATGGTCLTGSPASANASGVPFTVTPKVTPGISVVNSATPICIGSASTFTATIANGGSSPQYQWYSNGSALPGATGSTYSFNATTAGSFGVSCQLISNAVCTTPSDTVVSTPLSLTVNPSVGLPTISGPALHINKDDTTIYTVSAANATSYTWTLLPANAGFIAGQYPNFQSATVNWGQDVTGLVTISVSANGCNGPTSSVTTTTMLYSDIGSPTILPYSQNVYSAADIVPLTVSRLSGGDGNYSYQWEDSVKGGQWILVSGNNTGSYAPASLSANTYYRLQVSDLNDTVYSNTAYIGLSFYGGIITADLSVVAPGGSANLVSVDGAKGDSCQGNYTYLWQSSADGFNWVLFPGPAISGLSQTGYFQRVAICGNDTAVSNTVVIKVKAVVGTIVPAAGAPVGNQPVTPLIGYPGITDPENMNFVRTRNFSKPGISDTVTADAQNVAADVHQSTIYYDGLGRPIQTVAKQATPGMHDLISPQLYDPFGRESQKFLPYADAAATGHFRTDDSVQQPAFYNQLYSSQENYYYSQVLYDGSSANQPIKTTAPGISWTGNNKGVSEMHRTNALYDSVVIWNGGYSADTLPVFGGYYDPGSLMVMESTDENANKTIEYKDKYGQLVLKKVQQSDAASVGHAGWLCTYYVYNDLNALTAVLPPQAVSLLQAGAWSFGSPLLSGSQIAQELCYFYQYDARKRMTVKKTPGVGRVTMVYDARDRLVMSQDSLLRQQGKWEYTQYDSLNRPSISGLWTTTGDRVYQQSQAGAVINYPGPNSGNEVLTQTYYDDYSWAGQGNGGLPAVPDYSQTTKTGYFLNPSNTAFPYSQPIVAAPGANGLKTGTKVEVLGTGTYLYQVVFYDDRSRMIQQINTNITGGKDTITNQYSFDGKLLNTLQQHQYKNGDNSYQDYQLATQLQYDAAGRLLNITKSIDGGPDTLISVNSYNELGQLRRKDLGKDPANPGNPLDSLVYSYTLRGWVNGINKNYANDLSPYSTQNWFGMELDYDQGFNQPQYTGNIAGIKWRSRGTDTANAYGFDYDNLSRLLRADFTQHSLSGAWDISRGINFSTRNLQYDLNGNIGSMTQFGVRVNQSAIIDSLTYGYFPTSNKLQYVTDQANDTASILGDFKEKVNNSSPDYAYDGNGNLTLDNNKGIGSIAYNYLNLPQSIVIPGKGTIAYSYDAGGNKLQKIVTDNTVNPARITTTTYAGAFTYQNDTLQFIGQEEGKLRPDSIGKPQYPFTYDFFVRDHLGDTRMVLTEQQQTDFYPAATMEPDHEGLDTLYYTNINTTRTLVPPGYPTDTSYSNPNQYVAELDGNANKIGPGMTLKVMSGDKISIQVAAWYQTLGQSPATPLTPVPDLLSVLASSIPLASGGKMAVSMLSGPVLQPSVVDFLTQRDASELPAQPKAYLNWVLFDDQLKFVSAGSGFKQVDSNDVTQAIVEPNLPIPVNGYLYIYTSNETPNIPVYFDNLKVTHVRGPLLEENHYYPFGLAMAGLGDKALKMNYTENKYRYNGKELQNKEFSDGSGLEEYDYGARLYDPQIGRWNVPDGAAANASEWSPYRYGFDNPVRFLDPSGNYETDGHFWTVYLMATMMGSKLAFNFAYWAESPDHLMYESGDAIKATNTWLNPLNQGPLHALTGGLSSVERFLSAVQSIQSTSSEELGLGLHRLGDSYAHSTIDDPKVMYDAPWGHVVDMTFRTDPDKIANRPELYKTYVGVLEQVLGYRINFKGSVDKFTFNYIADKRGSTEQNSAILETEVRIRQKMGTFSVAGNEVDAINEYVGASNDHFGRNVQVNAVYTDVDVYNLNADGEWVKTKTEKRTFVTIH